MLLNRSSTVGAQRAAVSAVFFLNGAVFGNWVTRIPAVSDATGASPGALGLALLCLAIGSIGAMSLIGRVIDRSGAARVTVATGLATAASVTLPGLVTDVVVLGVVLLVYGAAFGALDVAMNVAAMQVVRRSGRPIMASFHAAFSLGGLAGAGTGALAATVGLPPPAHLAAVGAVAGAGVLAVARGLPPGERVGALAGPAGQQEVAGVWRRPGIWVFGAIALCAAFSEGAMADWTALFLRDEVGTGEGVAALGYAAFAVAMTVARLGGEQVLRLLGRSRALVLSGAVAAAGVSLAVAVPAPVVALVGFALAGLGLAVAFPVAMQGGAESVPEAEGRGVAAVSVIGYAGFLAGPPLIGFLAELVTLRYALGAVAVLALLGAAAGSRAPTGSPGPVETAA